ncbi:unnamed protein product, partial [Scytosiphon promiscuus]
TFSHVDQADCLLHGHSYTAHPVGCAAAVEFLSQVSKSPRSHDLR